MKTLILGGNGFMGSHLSKALLEVGHAVRVFDQPGSIGCLPGSSKIEYVYGEFTNCADVERALAGCEVVFHLISTTLPKSSNEDPLFDLNTNLVATVKMLDIARRNRVRKIVFASSGGTIYGIPSEIPIPETHPTEPRCSYGVCKLAIEKYLHLYADLHGISYCILRIGNPYGEGQQWNKGQGAVAVFVNRALSGDAIDIWGDGSVIRDYVYVGDVTEAFLKAMTYEGRESVFNVGSGRGYSLNELVATLEFKLGRSIKRNYLPTRDFDVPVNILNIRLAQELLSWAPRTTLADGLRRTLDWQRQQGLREQSVRAHPA